MMKTKLMAAIAAATMAVTSMAAMPFSASATSYLPYMLGDVNGDFTVNALDSSYILSALNSHGLAKGSRISVTYVQSHLSDWFPNAVCAKAADANEDGYISYDDADDVLSYYASVQTGGSGYKNIGNLYVYVAN